MAILRHLVCLGLVARSLAQHIGLDIPAVDAIVQDTNTKFANYTGLHGSNSTGNLTTSSSNLTRPLLNSLAAVSDPAYWLADIAHQGISAFNPGYQVFRNVKDFGAQGDGVTDDTAAINSAISSGNRCPPNGVCMSSTLTSAVVYFPAGTYLVSSPIVDYYFTQLIGNPNSLATLKATAGFSTPGGYAGVIEADPYGLNGNNANYGSTGVFYRQIRNLIIDTTSVPANVGMTGIHWPTSQATSIQNVQIHLNQASGTQHQGIYMQDGSGGFMNDITIIGGLMGYNIGNQQFTIRNIQISNAITAISQIWDWGFTWKSLNINNCSVGLDMSSGGQSVGSITLLDSTFTNTGVAIKTAYTSGQSTTKNSLIIENVVLSNVPVAVQGIDGSTQLAGGSTTISAWGEGHEYTPNGPTGFMGTYSATPRASGLLTSGNKYYEMSKPLYASTAVGNVLSVRSAGAKGDGSTDDTAALQAVINQGASQGKLVFFDAGTYKVTSTLLFPPGSQIVGETYSVIMGAGATFSNINNPVPVVRIGTSGQSGSFQWSDMIVSTQGAAAGAVLIEWNLAASTGSGIWDVHTRIGGFTGSNLQVAQCPTQPATVNSNCIAAYMSMHITSSASNVYLENVWLWTADHDLDTNSGTQISIYTGRGLLIEAATVWLYGTAVEHHQLYQYQLANTHTIYMGFIQTETPYWQPTPDAKTGPYTANATLNDPTYSNCLSGNCDALGLRILNCQNIFNYGAGLYSFFNSYSTTCSDNPGPENCQSEIFSVEGGSTTNNVFVYNLNTIGTPCMIVRDGTCIANEADNENVYPETIALYRTN